MAMQSSTDSKPHLLVVDDDDRLRKLLGRFLCEHGCMVTEAADAAQAHRALEWFVFDLMILDVMMPGQTGLELLAALGERRRLPVLMLSALGEADDRIRGLETGAEDYLAKPFEPKELLLRVQAILRRAASTQGSAGSVVFGEYRFDLASGRLSRSGEPVHLTTAESALLALLAARPGTPQSREQLAAQMAGASSERSVDVQVTRLRKKIEASAGRPLYLQTVRGAGYVLHGRREGA